MTVRLLIPRNNAALNESISILSILCASQIGKVELEISHSEAAVSVPKLPALVLPSSHSLFESCAAVRYHFHLKIDICCLLRVLMRT